MPRAEVGSTKHIANQMKSKGLQRLRWYCQACQRQMRDENGFKCHVASESHVRNMQLIGEDPRKAISDFSRQFERDFLQLLRTGHGEKKVNLNQFYQEYIANKEHVHMNATKWASLTEYAKYLGRQGLCRVEEDEKDEGRGGASALMISWIDNSPEALRRQEALRKKERQDRGDDEREQRMIQDQIRRAKRGGPQTEDVDDDVDSALQADEGIRRRNGEKVVLAFGKKPAEPEKPPSPPLTDRDNSSGPDSSAEADATQMALGASPDPPLSTQPTVATGTKAPSAKPLAFNSSKPKNVFATVSKKNALGGTKKPVLSAPSKPMSEAERIMKEEIERKRHRQSNAGNPTKKPRFS